MGRLPLLGKIYTNAEGVFIRVGCFDLSVLQIGDIHGRRKPDPAAQISCLTGDPAAVEPLKKLLWRAGRQGIHLVFQTKDHLLFLLCCREKDR